MARPTIRDVAAKSGYSISTVSLVLNKKNVSIPDSTKEKVWQAVKALNYRPNQLAVGMITKKTKVLGLIIPDNSNIFFADISKAIEKAAHRAGYSLIYGNSSNDNKRDLEYLNIFADRQVDGIIFAKSASYNTVGEEMCLQFIKDNDIPLVTIDRQISNSDTVSVMLNHFEGGYQATKHLLDLGHIRIGCYTGPRDLANSMERLMGYRFALEEAGIAFDDALTYEGNYQFGSELAALTHLLNQKVSAVFAFNDLMAFGIYQAASHFGLSIPQDISVVGFDDVYFSQIIHPKLTTIRQPIKEMGECATELLIKMINQDELNIKQRNYVFEPTLILRDSTAKVAYNNDMIKGKE